MDRFEVTAGLPPNSLIAIYIPVWIDLKTPLFFQQSPLIPHLHSSMDRFEDRSLRRCERRMVNLHSSMDRFEVINGH